MFQPNLKTVETLTNQPKMVFPNGKRKDPTELTNLRRLIPIEHDLSKHEIKN